MRNSVGALLLVAGVVLFCSCGRSTEYFPLSPGAQWEYSVEYPTTFSGPKKGKVVSRIDGTQTINGKTYYKMVTVSSGIPGSVDETSFYRPSSEGIYRLEGTDEQLVFPASLDEGTTWTVNGSKGQMQYRVEGTAETAHLLDKKFENCLKVSFEGDQTSEGVLGPEVARIRGLVYRAKGIGEVKMVLEGSSGKVEFALESYTH